jgi:hypothetical protein
VRKIKSDGNEISVYVVLAAEAERSLLMPSGACTSTLVRATDKEDPEDSKTHVRLFIAM